MISTKGTFLKSVLLLFGACLAALVFFMIQMDVSAQPPSNMFTNNRSVVYGAPPASLEEIYHIGGVVSASDGLNGTQFISQGANLTVIQRNGGTLTKVGSLPLSDLARHMDISGDHLFLSYDGVDWMGYLGIFDISDPLNPVRLTITRLDDIEQEINRFAAADSRVYLMMGKTMADSKWIRIVDVSDPSSPNLVDSLEDNFVDFAVSGDSLYFIRGNNVDHENNKLVIWDISDPADPQEDVVMDLPYATNLYLSNTHLYVGMVNGLGLRIYDVSDSKAPALLGEYNPGSVSYYEVIVGNGLAFARTDGMLNILDVSNTANPQFVSDYVFGDFGIDHYGNGTLSIRCNNRFMMFDVSDTANPNLLAETEGPTLIDGMAIVGNHLAVATGNDAIYLYDLVDPEAPELTARFPMLNAGTLFGNTHLLFNTDWAGTITIVDITDPQNPALQTTYQSTNTPVGILSHGNLTFILNTDRTGGQQAQLEILDLTDPANPDPKGNLMLAGNGKDMAFSEEDSMVYVVWWTTAGRGIQVIDASDPENPVSLTQFGVDQSIQSIVFENATLFVGKYEFSAGGGSSAIDVYDVTDPSSPQFLHSHSVSATAVLHDMLYMEDVLIVSLPRGESIRTYGYDFNGHAFTEGPSLPLASPTVLDGYAPSSLAKSSSLPKKSSANQDEGNWYLFTQKGKPSGFHVFGYNGVNEVLVIPPYATPELIVDIDEYGGSNICPPMKGKLFQIADGTLKASGDDWMVLSMTVSSEGNDYFKYIFDATMVIQGDSIFGNVIMETDSTTRSVTLDVNTIIPEGPAVPFEIFYEFNFPSRVDTVFAPGPIDEGVLTYGVSIAIDQVNAKPVVKPYGVILPPLPERLYSPLTTIASIWNITLLPRKGFATIQEAINAPITKDGHTIDVCPGLYAENVFVMKSITLQGHYVPNIYSKKWDYPSMLLPSSDVGAVTINATDATVKHFLLKNRDIHVLNSNATIVENYIYNSQVFVFNTDHCTIRKNEFDGGGDNIVLEGSNHCLVEDNNLWGLRVGVKLYSSSNNRFINSGRKNYEHYNEFMDGEQDFHIKDGSDNNYIYRSGGFFYLVHNSNDNELLGNRMHGIMVSQCKSNYIYYNEITHEEGIGVAIDESGGYLYRNNINYNQLNGIRIIDTPPGYPLVLLMNTIYLSSLFDVKGDKEHFCDGIFINNGHAQIVNNTIHKGTNCGIGISNCNSGQIKIQNNRIYNHTKGLGTGVYARNSSNISIMNNAITKNLTGSDIDLCSNVTFFGNKIYGNTSPSTGIHLDGSIAEITGNLISGNKGNGIQAENGSQALINFNNLFDNDGFEVQNVDHSIIVDASLNWWGTKDGPANDDFSGEVDTVGWLAEPVVLVMQAEADTVYFELGESDSVVVFLQNLNNNGDVVDVTIHDPYGWVTDDTLQSVTLDDSVGCMLPIHITIPYATNGTTSCLIEVEAVSQMDNAWSAKDEFLIISYLPQLTGIHVWPDSAMIMPGDSIHLFAAGYDQHGNTRDELMDWNATGGTIDSTGLFIAGDNEGTFTVTATDTSGLVKGQVVVIITSETSVESAKDYLPLEFTLHQNYPNPFNPSTTFVYALPQACVVTLKVFDILGRELEILVEKRQEAGEYKRQWRPTNLPSGIYLCHLQAGDFVQTKKFVFQK